MNSLDALAATAKEGAGIGWVPSWQAEADLAAGRLVRLLGDCERAPVPLHLMFQASRPASLKIGASPITSLNAVAASIRSARCRIPNNNRINIQFLNRAKRPWYTKPLINRIS